MEAIKVAVARPRLHRKSCPKSKSPQELTLKVAKRPSSGTLLAHVQSAYKSPPLGV